MEATKRQQAHPEGKKRNSYYLLAVISPGLVVLLLISLLFFYLNKEQDISERQLAGIGYLRLLLNIESDIEVSRGLRHAQHTTDLSLEQAVMHNSRRVSEQVEALLEHPLTLAYGLSENVESLREAVALMRARIGMSSQGTEGERYYADILSILTDMRLKVGGRSALLLEQTGNAHYLVGLLIQSSPALTDKVGKVRALGYERALQSNTDSAAQLSYATYLGELSQLIKELKRLERVVFRQDPTIGQDGLDEQLQVLVYELQRFVEQGESLNKRVENGQTLRDYYLLGSGNIEAIHDLERRVIQLFKQQVQEHKASLQRIRFLLILASVASLVLAGYGVLHFYRVTRKAMNELEWARRMYRVLSEVSALIVLKPQRERLLSKVADIVVKEGGLRMVWMGLLEPESQAVVPYYSAGYEEGYLEELKITLTDEERSRGPTATSIREGRPVVTADIASDPRMQPWRDAALQRGYASAASFPFYEHDRIAGSLNVYAESKHYFTLQLVDLFSNLAEEISHGLEVLETVEQRDEARQKLMKMNRELERRVAQRTAELEQSNRELEAFSYSVSHDLRAPLRGMDGFSHLLLKKYRGQLDETAQDYLQRIRRATQNMGRIIDDILSLSRVSRYEINRKRVDMSAMAEEILLDFQAREPGRLVEWQVAEGMEVAADARMIRIALENLLGNAWKYTAKKEGAVIEFGRHRGDDGTVGFVVRDNGAGFDMAYADKLFGAFQRLHTSEQFEGSGIGLATVKRVVERHGGHIWAEAEPGKGASFYFNL